MTALNVAVVLLASAGMILWQKGWKKYKVLWIPMACFYIGFLLNVAAPGNWVRAEGADGMNPVKAVLVSFYECLDRMMGEWTTWPVIVIMIALAALFWHMADQISFNFPCPLLAVAFGFCLASAMVTPPVFAVGNMEAGRLQALAFLMYVLVLALCVGYVTGWAKKRQSAGGSAGDRRFSPEGRYCLLGCAALLVFGTVLVVVPEPHYYTFSSAMTDLRNGSAKAYGKALEKRAELYHSGLEGVIEVEPLPSQPTLLYFSDIKVDAHDWENEGLCRFYGLEGVVVKEKK